MDTRHKKANNKAITCEFIFRVGDTIGFSKQSNLDIVEKTLLEVSNPDSPRYGQYLSLEQVGYIVHNSAALDAVKTFLLGHGVHESQIEITANGEFVTVHVPVHVAETMLDAKFYVFANTKAPAIQVLRTDAYSVPAGLEAHLDFIGETIEFPTLKARKIRRGPVKNGYVTPELLNQVYNVKSNQVKSTKATQSVFESLGQSYSPADLEMFQNRMGLPQSEVARGGLYLSFRGLSTFSLPIFVVQSLDRTMEAPVNMTLIAVVKLTWVRFAEQHSILSFQAHVVMCRCAIHFGNGYKLAYHILVGRRVIQLVCRLGRCCCQRCQPSSCSFYLLWRSRMEYLHDEAIQH